MSAQALLNALADYDIRVAVEGDHLLVNTPKGALTAALRAALIEHKTGLLAILRQNGPGYGSPPPRVDAHAWKRLAVEHDRTAELTANCNPEAAVAWRRDAAHCRMFAEYGIGPWDLPADWRVEFEERAAIREYEGGQAREHAEAEALGEIVRRMHAEAATNTQGARQ